MLGPDGAHVFSLETLFTPYGLTGGWPGSRRAATLAGGVRRAGGGRLPRRRGRHAGDDARPLRARLLHAAGLRAVLRRWAGGRAAGAGPELSRYRTPLGGLYLTGAATFPGAGIWGASGRNTAAVVLADLDRPDRLRPHPGVRRGWVACEAVSLRGRRSTKVLLRRWERGSAALRRGARRARRRGAHGHRARRHADHHDDAHPRPRLRAGQRLLPHRGPARRARPCSRAATAPTVPASESGYNLVSVDTGGVAPLPQPRLGLTTSACGLCGSATLTDLRLRLEPLPETEPIPLEVLAAVPARARAGQELFERTGAVHAAAAFDRDGTILLTREDVGRHNAVDKVVGRLLLDGALPATGLGLFVSGRASFELVQKAWAGRLRRPGGGERAVVAGGGGGPRRRPHARRLRAHRERSTSTRPARSRGGRRRLGARPERSADREGRRGRAGPP